MPDPVSIAEQIAKRRSWIEGPIRSDVVNMHFKRMLWREVNAMMDANRTVAESPSAFWNFVWGNYATAQAIAIRRQADVRRDTCSLGRLITEMSNRADHLTRECYVSLLAERSDDELMVQVDAPRLRPSCGRRRPARPEGVRSGSQGAPG